VSVPVKIHVMRKSIATGFSTLQKLGLLGLSEEVVDSKHNAKSLSVKHQGELNAFLNFSMHENFTEIVQRAAGRMPDIHALNIELLSEGEDPPDICLQLRDGCVGIEVTYFPPHFIPLDKESAKTKGIHAIPLFHETGSNPRKINDYIGNPDFMAHWGDGDKERVALTKYAEDQIRRKDTASSEILLMYGVDIPEFEGEGIRAAIEKVRPKHLKAIVVVASNKRHQSVPFYPT
jgi:hypothetical protein